MARETDSADYTVGVVGTGTMGRGIMQVSATGGMNVLAYDEDCKASASAKEAIAGFLNRAVEKGRMSTDNAKSALDRISITNKLEDMAGADLIVEAIVEKLEAKKELFASLDNIVPDHAILATNTSSLPVTGIAAACKTPERVAGLHFFNPVPLMKLVEIIPGIHTADWVVEALMKVGARMGRDPVRCADSPGFLVNHIGRAYMPEALRILSEGIAGHADIDRIMTGAPGFRMGPMALVDLVGADVAISVMESIHRQYYMEPAYQPSQTLSLRAQSSLLGRKTGAGFYRYSNGNKIEPESARTPSNMPSRVWISPEFENDHAAVRAVAEAAGVEVENDAKPGSGTIAILTPVGTDLSTAISANGLSPDRTVAVDSLFGLETQRTLMICPATRPEVREQAHSLFGADGTPVAVINDSPGFVSQRIVAMVVNVACHMAQRGVASPTDIDKGARLGLNYPVGPFELAEQVRPARICRILDALHSFYGEPRYRPAAWLKRRVHLGLPLATPDAAV